MSPPRLLRRALTTVILLTSAAAAPATLEGMALVPAGDYAPLLRAPDDSATVPIPAFFLDERPVTNAEFLAFVTAEPRWRRSRLAPLYADPGYLGDWTGDLAPRPGAPAESPVVRVSWFAARA